MKHIDWYVCLVYEVEMPLTKTEDEMYKTNIVINTSFIPLYSYTICTAKRVKFRHNLV